MAYAISDEEEQSGDKLYHKRIAIPKANHYIIVAFTMHVNIYISDVLAIELI